MFRQWRACAREVLALILLFGAMIYTVPATAARVALVIGNDNYHELPSLQKSGSDAASFAKLFKDKQFDKVIFKQDLTRTAMDQVIADFIDAVHPGDTAVFVYAGHGWSDGTLNYIVGVDAPKGGTQSYLKRISIPVSNGVDGIVDALNGRGATLKVAIIDACRDNPFTNDDGTRSIGEARGLDRMTEPPHGTFVVFSAGVGQTALDRLSDGDTNPNGIFTRALVPLLEKDMTLLDATVAAQEAVFRLASTVNHPQQPAFYDEVLGNNACLSTQCGLSGSTSPAPADIAWQQIQGSKTPGDFEAFSKFFPGSPHSAEARAMAASLRQDSASLQPGDTSSVPAPGDGPVSSAAAYVSGNVSADKFVVLSNDSNPVFDGYQFNLGGLAIDGRPYPLSFFGLLVDYKGRTKGVKNLNLLRIEFGFEQLAPVSQQSDFTKCGALAAGNDKGDPRLHYGTQTRLNGCILKLMDPGDAYALSNLWAALPGLVHIAAARGDSNAKALDPIFQHMVALESPAARRPIALN